MRLPRPSCFGSWFSATRAHIAIKKPTLKVGWRRLSGVGGFEFRRDDDVDRFGVALRWPVLDNVRLYARYDYTRNDSNIRFFDYDQQVASAGVVVEC